ncbi:MAG: hypothetical protein JO110_04680 [Acetobacteraceae bacterium]|nr:hypothetical protein [Acetobacteraceae bacterium]
MRIYNSVQSTRLHRNHAGNIAASALITGEPTTIPPQKLSGINVLLHHSKRRAMLAIVTMVSLPLLTTAANATPIIRNGIASYFNPDDQLNHAIVATTDGSVHEVYYSNTTVFGTDVLATFSPGTLAGIGACYGNGANHVIVQQTDGKVTELYWVGGQGVQSASLGTFVQPDAIGNCFFDADTVAHVPIVFGPQGTPGDEPIAAQIEYSPAIGIHFYNIGGIDTNANVRGITAWMANSGVAYVHTPVIVTADDNTVLFSEMIFGGDTANTFEPLGGEPAIPTYSGSTPVGIAGTQISPELGGCNQVFYAATNATGGNWNVFGQSSTTNANGLAPCTGWVGVFNIDDNSTAISAFATDNPAQLHLVMTTRSNRVYQLLATSSGGWYRLDLGSF